MDYLSPYLNIVHELNLSWGQISMKVSDLGQIWGAVVRRTCVMAVSLVCRQKWEESWFYKPLASTFIGDLCLAPFWQFCLSQSILWCHFNVGLWNIYYPTSKRIFWAWKGINQNIKHVGMIYLSAELRRLAVRFPTVSPTSPVTTLSSLQYPTYTHSFISTFISWIDINTAFKTISMEWWIRTWISSKTLTRNLGPFPIVVETRFG